jgi:hypothetical protein
MTVTIDLTMPIYRSQSHRSMHARVPLSAADDRSLTKTG